MHFKRLVLPVLGLVVTVALAAAQRGVSRPSFVPPRGYVPDAATAVAIARAVLLPVYGKTAIAAEEPLRATRDGDAWNVNGALPQGAVGGTAYVRISRRTGAIIALFHTK